MKRTLSLFGVLLFLFTGCQSEIDIDIPDYHDKLVVEGTIETGKPAMVLLSKSIPYFSDIDFETLLEKFIIQDAVITVTSGSGESEVLRFRYTEESPLLFAYTGQNLIGRPDEEYALSIELEGKTYTATTYIPHTFELDSIWFQQMGKPEDSIATVRLILSDDPSRTDYYQFLVKVRGKNLQDRLWAYTMLPVFDDATFNGMTFNYEIFRATPSTLYAATLSEQERREYYRPYFRPGDTVFVKYSLMDYPSYRFWSTATTEISFGQNVFMSPPPIASNIKSSSGEKVLGSWCGYAAKIDMLIYSE